MELNQNYLLPTDDEKEEKFKIVRWFIFIFITTILVIYIISICAFIINLKSKLDTFVWKIESNRLKRRLKKIESDSKSGNSNSGRLFTKKPQTQNKSSNN